MRRGFLLVGLSFFSLLASSLAGCGAHNQAAIALYERGDYAGASRAADQGLASHPDDEGLWQMRLRTALAQGDGDALARTYASYARTRAPGDLDKDVLRDLATATLRQALASPSAKLKIAAIEVVEQVELHALADQVAERMEDDNDRVAATAAAAVLRGFPQAPQLLDQLLHSDDPEARAIAVNAIGKKVGRLALPDLEKAASDRDPLVRRAALRWLGQLHDLEVHELLAKRLRDPDDGVRAAAASALARIGTGNLAELGKRALADHAIAVRLAGIELYAAAHAAAALGALLDDPSELVALTAAIELRGTRPDAGAPALSRALKAEAWTTRAAALNLAARAVDRATVKTVAAQLANDPEVGVRLAAARALAHAGDRSAAIAILVAALAGNVAAAADLAELGDARGDDALSAAMRDVKRPADDRAQAAFAHRTAHRVTPGLVAALADPSALVRVEAAATLAILTR
ncbi:MAG: HEAT repeat domain-containing protein [Proteobacteria bacterium]|nr:HEAT repeat domain-containing protein [Pseudomonadota bacterium]